MILLIIKLDYLIRNTILTILQFIFFKNWTRRKINKIIVFRTGSIGDVVCAFPALSAIRLNFPDAEIDILTNAGSKSYVSMDKLIDPKIVNEVIDYYGSTNNDLFKQLKQKKYDFFIELPQTDAALYTQIRNLFFVKFLGIESAFGWQISTTLLFKRHQEKFIKFENERDRLLNILKKNRIDISSFSYPLHINKSDSITITKLLNEQLLHTAANNVAFVIGAKVEANKWPLSHFAEVANYLINIGKNILIIGGPGEVGMAEELKIHIKKQEKIYNFCGKFTPVQSAILFKYCQFTISNDTGPMHLSYAMGTPVIAIFSSRHYPYKWFPPSDNKNIVFRNNDVACSVCYTSTCNKNKICITNIKPSDIIRNIETNFLHTEVTYTY